MAEINWICPFGIDGIDIDYTCNKFRNKSARDGQVRLVVVLFIYYSVIIKCVDKQMYRLVFEQGDWSRPTSIWN